MKRDDATIIANGAAKHVKLPCTVADFVTACGWKPTQVVVEHNGRVLERNRLDAVALADGDRIEVIVPVAGG